MRNFFAFILLAIFSVIFFIALLLNNLHAVLLQARIYKDALAQGNFYPRILEKVIEIYLTEENFQQVQMPFLNISLLKTVAQRTISPLWLQGQVEKILDNLFLLLNGQNLNEVSFRISLAEPKEKLLTEAQNVVREELNKLPTCTPEQLQAMQHNQSMVNCLPSGFQAEDIFKAISFTELEKFIPNELELKDFLQAESKQRIEATISHIQMAVQILNSTLIIAYAILAVLLVLLFLFTKRILASGFRWVGFTLSLPSGFGMLAAYLMRRFSLPFINQFLQDPRIMPFRDLINSFIAELFDLLFDRYLLFNIIFFGIGVLFFIISFFLHKKRV